MAADQSEHDRLSRARSLLLRAVESLDGTPAPPQSQGPQPGSSSASSSSDLSSVFTERNSLFNFGKKRKGRFQPRSKKKKLSMWTHDFICLNSKSCTRPPSSLQIGELMRCGLGKKTISLLTFGDSSEIHDEIITAFPALKDAGGYELLRVGELQRNSLVVIPHPPEGYTVEYLKEVVRQAKVYIRPLQQDLRMEVQSSGSVPNVCPSEKCFICGINYPLPKLPEHVTLCKSPESPSPLHSEAGEDEDLTQEIICIENDDTEQQILDHVIAESQLQVGVIPPATLCSPRTLQEVVTYLQRKLICTETFEFQISRENVLEDILSDVGRRAYDPPKKVKVRFVGEEGDDTGGLSRELWRLFAKEVEKLCEGKESMKIFRHDSAKLQEGVFRKIGMIMGVSFLHGSSGYPFFAPSSYAYLSGVELSSISVNEDEIINPEVAIAVHKICSVGSDDTKLREVAMEECDTLISCGYTKPIPALTHQDMPQLIRAVALHTTVLAVKAELDQLVQGLREAGVLEEIRSYPDLFRPLFVCSSGPLSAVRLMELFEVKVFSEQGSSNLQAVYIFFKNLLEEMEGGDVPVTLSDCLAFFTGSGSVPPFGFDNPCTLNFNEGSEFPTASTCALVLTLPTVHYDNYDFFKDKMVYGFRNHGGFGLR